MFKLSRSKTSVASWLMLSGVGVVATAISAHAEVFQLSYAFPTLIVTMMLHWMRTDAHYYQQPFYRYAWLINQLLIITLALVLWFWRDNLVMT